jgi:uncharacterized membrane protein YfcA
VPEPWRTLLTLAAGVGTGVLSGAFGVGGAVVSTPAIRALGATPLEGVGSTLPSILPSAISGSMRYRREGLIMGRVVVWTVAFGLAGSVGGALLSSAVPGDGHLLMIVTAGLLAFTAYRTASAPDSVGDALATARVRGRREESWRLAAIGIAAGVLSGLLGVGGGILMVPAFSGWVRLTIKEAVATSLVCVGALAVPGTIAHALLGHVDWGLAIPLSIAVIPGARVGANLAVRATDRGLRRGVGIVLGTVAVIYATGEIVALTR